MSGKAFDPVGFVGGGRVTRFLLEGWQRADALPTETLVCDPDQSVVSRLKGEFKAVRSCPLSEVARAPLVVLAVHPPDLKALLGELKGTLAKTGILLSLAPKISIAAIQSALGVRQVVRMIPNAPSAIGRGYNPVAYGAAVDAEAVGKLERVFAPWGEAPRVPEDQLEAYAILSAMGPTYMWFQWEKLRELAADFGLSSEAADDAILKMVVGAAECLLAYRKDPAGVIDMVPVKPLQPEEESFCLAYSTRLGALYQKLKS